MAAITGDANASSVAIQGLSGGTATLALTVTDSLGGSATTTQSVTVLHPVQAGISASSATPEVGDTVTLDASASTVDASLSVVSYAWTITEGAALASFTGATDGTMATLNVTGEGSIVVQLTVTDNAGQTSTVTQTLTATAPHYGGGAMALWWQAGLLVLGLMLRRRSF